MGDIAAADVESPGDGMGVVGEDGVGLEGGELLADARELGGDPLAGERLVLHDDRRERGRGAIGPDRVDGVGVDRDERRAGALGRRGEALDLGHGVEARVVAEALTGLELRPEPGLDGLLDRVARRDRRGVDLLADLHGVASVDEDRGLVGEDHGGAGGARETGQPGEALLGGRHVLVLVLVGAGHDEAVEAEGGKGGTQRGDPGGALAGVGDLVEGLEGGHGRSDRSGVSESLRAEAPPRRRTRVVHSSRR